jgi:hypothetical protein
MGQDPASGLYVPYNATDYTFNQHWQEIVMKPLEEAGIDFWWLEYGIKQSRKHGKSHSSLFAGSGHSFVLVCFTRLSCFSSVGSKGNSGSRRRG